MNIITFINMHIDDLLEQSRKHPESLVQTNTYDSTSSSCISCINGVIVHSVISTSSHTMVSSYSDDLALSTSETYIKDTGRMICSEHSHHGQRISTTYYNNSSVKSRIYADLDGNNRVEVKYSSVGANQGQVASLTYDGITLHWNADGLVIAIATECERIAITPDGLHTVTYDSYTRSWYDAVDYEAIKNDYTKRTPDASLLCQVANGKSMIEASVIERWFINYNAKILGISNDTLADICKYCN